jgi:biotin operon repressor
MNCITLHHHAKHATADEDKNTARSRKELSKKLGINESAVQKHIESLKRKGAIERKGKTRGAWKIIE